MTPGTSTTVVRGEEGDGITVLAVDDERGLVEMTAEFLERHDDGMTVLTETRPTAALDRLASTQVDCVVSDYQMPKMDGVEFLRAVREEHPDLPFILYTGKGSETVASEAISAGVTDYLQKSDGTGEEYGVLAQQIRTSVERRWAVERFDEFLESTPDATLIVDAEGTIVELNSRAAELFGYEREELTGERIEVVLPERFREDHVDHRERYMDDPEPRPMGEDLDLYGLKADGTEFPVDVAISPVEVGGRLEVLAAVRDISTRRWREEELRERERELQRQNERLAEFASIVSHDLQSPLTVARGNLELARESDDPDEHIAEAERALDRMSALVDDVLKLAREGQTVDDIEPVALDDVVRDAWHTAATGDATLATTPDATVLADASRLRELFENLFANSAAHGAADGSVTVEVAATEEGFVVDDDGEGIPPAEREDVFDHGYSTADGTGLGLTIVKRIAEAHGWSVSVDASPSDGARFVFTGVDRPE